VGLPSVAARALADHLFRLELSDRRSAGAHHRRVALDDELAWIRLSVRLRLLAAARVVLHVEVVDIAAAAFVG
jgi:hypothetical protein